jgi:GT2 family glycosyltransferase
MNETGPRVLVLVLAWNGRELTEACIDSILQLDYPHFDVLVVDNASSDGTPAALRRRFGTRIEVLENSRNLLFAAGMNVGLERALAAGYDAVLLLNNDVVLDAGMLRALVEALGREARIAAVGPKIYYFDAPQVIWFAGGELSLWRGWPHHRGLREVDRGQHDVLREVDYLTGCAYLVRTAALRDVGLFDPSYAMYAEDADWSFRARERGWRLVYAPQARLWHHVSASSGARSWFKVRRRFRSQLRFLGRHARWYHKLVIPFGTFAEALRVGWGLVAGKKNGPR